jgi:predicted GIY-YIG superfamily endonuclease
MARKKKTPSNHHSVYVVYLRDPKGDGKAGYYVGMTGLSPEERFENHKRGYKSAAVVARCGERLVPKLYEHLNPMSYAKAVEMEAALADSLRKRGFVVFGGH